MFYTYLWIFLNYNQVQRDFPVYWTAAKAWQSGLNPYQLDNLSAVWQQTMNLPYTYTPLPLLLFLPLALLSYAQAFAAFFALKWLFFFILIAIWLKYWIKTDRVLFVIFALAAYNRAIWGDLVAGNVVLIEQALLWGAFTILPTGRYLSYGVAVTAAAVFKLVPAVWAGPLFLLRSWRAAFTGLFIIGATLLLHGLAFHWTGFTLQDWFGSILWEHGGGRGNPCVQAFFKDLQHMYGFPFAKPAYLAIAASVVGITLWTWLRFPPKQQEQLRQLLLFSCLSLSFVLGEFKGYSYILLIIPTWVAWTQIAKKNPLWLTIAFLILETAVELSAYPPFGLLWNYSPLFIAAVSWWLYVRSFHSESASSCKCK